MYYENKNKILERALTVAELIEALQDFSPDARVVFESDYGDYGHSMQALLVKRIDEVEYRDFAKSRYSASGLVITEGLEDEDDGEVDLDEDVAADVGGDPVVVLR
jgi:hypothetical protein